MEVPFFKNSDGKKSASFTMVAIAFAVVTLWLLLSIAQKLGSVEIRPFAASDAMAYLSPILLLYFGRRKQDLESATETPESRVLNLSKS